MFKDRFVPELKAVVAELQSILDKESIQYDKTPTRKEELLQWICTYLNQETVIRKIYESLNEAEQGRIKESLWNMPPHLGWSMLPW